MPSVEAVSFPTKMGTASPNARIAQMSKAAYLDGQE